MISGELSHSAENYLKSAEIPTPGNGPTSQSQRHRPRDRPHQLLLITIYTLVPVAEPRLS